MTSAILTIVVLVLLAVMFGWLVSRAWHARHGYVKWPGSILAGLLTVLCAILAVIGGIGVIRLSGGGSPAAASSQVAVTQENTERVSRWVNGCAGCHSSTGSQPLDGSKDAFFDGPMGVMYAPNLTPGGPLKSWSDSQIARAIREGVDRDGHPLVIMPSEGFHNISDADTQALVNYLRGQPAVVRDLPARNLSLIPAALIGAGVFPTSAQSPLTGPVAAPQAGVTVDYGKYLVALSGCRDCHGPDLKGGQGGGFGPPGGSNLAGIVPQWQDTGFVNLMRTGKDPTGRQVSEDMPWKDFGKMFNDTELRAMYTYLKTLGS
jgi:mono/diheme cytochrome c family protein